VFYYYYYYYYYFATLNIRLKDISQPPLGAPLCAVGHQKKTPKYSKTALQNHQSHPKINESHIKTTKIHQNSLSTSAKINQKQKNT